MSVTAVDGLFKRLVAEGWMANVVVAVIITAATQFSALGIVLGLLAMIVSLITTSRFKSTTGGIIRSGLVFQTAARIGLALTLLCITASIYASLRPTLLSEMPKQALDVVVKEAEAQSANRVTAQIVPTIEMASASASIFGYKASEQYQIISARILLERMVGSGFSNIDAFLLIAVGFASFWFAAALIIGWLAEDFAQPSV
jgi:hypothetical protein